MSIKTGPVNPWSQLSLLPPDDVVITLQVTVHLREGFATVSLNSWAEPSDETLCIVARPAVPLDRVEDAVRELGSEFTTLLREHSGPFPHQYS